MADVVGFRVEEEFRLMFGKDGSLDIVSTAEPIYTGAYESRTVPIDVVIPETMAGHPVFTEED